MTNPVTTKTWVVPQVYFDLHLVLELYFQFFLCTWFLPKKRRDSVFQKLNSSIFSFPENVTFQFPENDMFNPPKKEHFNLPKMACLISRKDKFQSPENWSIVISRKWHISISRKWHISISRERHISISQKLKYYNFPKMTYFNLPKIVWLNLQKLKHCSSSREFPKKNILQQTTCHKYQYFFTLELYLSEGCAQNDAQNAARLLNNFAEIQH